MQGEAINQRDIDQKDKKLQGTGDFETLLKQENQELS